MKWLRSKLRHGSRIALFALAIQFVLSFGHFHGVAVQAAPIAVDQSVQSQQPSDHDSSQRTDDVCAICVVMAMASAALFATPPVLLSPQAIEFLPLATDAELILGNSVAVGFQSRAPPNS
jgi:hypothetical protein